MGVDVEALAAVNSDTEATEKHVFEALEALLDAVDANKTVLHAKQRITNIAVVLVTMGLSFYTLVLVVLFLRLSV